MPTTVLLLCMLAFTTAGALAQMPVPAPAAVVCAETVEATLRQSTANNTLDASSPQPQGRNCVMGSDPGGWSAGPATAMIRRREAGMRQRTSVVKQVLILSSALALLVATQQLRGQQPTGEPVSR